MKENLVLQGISKEHIKGYISDFLLIGTYYRRLYKFAFNQTLEDHFYSKGLVYEVITVGYIFALTVVCTYVYSI